MVKVMTSFRAQAEPCDTWSILREPTFAQCIEGEGRSGGAWLTELSGMRLYVRRAIRVKGGFELANIEVPEEKQQQGILTCFLAEYGHLPIKIENVLNSYLEQWLLRQPEWAPDDPDRVGLSASYLNRAWRERALNHG